MWYKILGLNDDATRDEIENAYRKKLCDPHISNDLEKSMELHNAYKEGLSQSSSYSLNEKNESSNKSKKSYYIISFVILICVLALLLSSVYLFIKTVTYKNPNADKELSSTFTFHECLAYNENRGYYSHEDARVYTSEDLSSDKYYNTTDLHFEFEGLRVLGEKVIVFDVAYNNNKSECTISIKESFEEDGIYIQKKIYTKGYNLDTYIVEYRFIDNNGMDTFISQFIYDYDTIDTYKLVEKESYKDAVFYKHLDEQKDLQSRDELIHAISEFD